MATPSNNNFISPLAHPVTERLTKNNYALWKLQVLPAICGAQLVGMIDGSSPAPAKEVEGSDGKGKVPNPAYGAWLAADQQIFTYLIVSLGKDMMKQVSSCETAANLWRTIEELCASQTRVRAVNIRIALATTKKGSMTIDEYVTKMKLGSNILILSGWVG